MPGLSNNRIRLWFALLTQSILIQDITRQEQRAALERTFYHDINNMLNILMQVSELLVEDYPSKLAETMHQTASRLVNEVSIQRLLSEHSSSSYQPMWDEYTIEKILEELQSFFSNHPAANEKTIAFSKNNQFLIVKTDISLLLRVFCVQGATIMQESMS